MAAPKKLLFVKWKMIDIVSYVLNIAYFNVIGRISVDQVLDPTKKQFLDYYVICVTVVSWLRMMSYFLLIRPISKLLNTLFRMLQDTFAFIFIIVCYYACAVIIFTIAF